MAGMSYALFLLLLLLLSGTKAIELNRAICTFFYCETILLFFSIARKDSL